MVSCKYFTSNGVKEVEKTLKKFEADNLFNLVDTWDIEEILNELERMKMLPENHDAEKTFNLIKGQYPIHTTADTKPSPIQSIPFAVKAILFDMYSP